MHRGRPRAAARWLARGLVAFGVGFFWNCNRLGRLTLAGAGSSSRVGLFFLELQRPRCATGGAPGPAEGFLVCCKLATATTPACHRWPPRGRIQNQSYFPPRRTSARQAGPTACAASVHLCVLCASVSRKCSHGATCAGWSAAGHLPSRPGCRRPHFAITPRNPPEISAATLARMRGSARPPGDARYRGSHTGSNFSLYFRNPRKL